MIFLDFDGTLVDLWPRYYAVFCDLTKLNNVSLSEYRHTKQKLIKDSLVTEYFGQKLSSDYFEKKRIMLEEKKYLSLDKLFFEKEEIQCLLKKNCIILSKRRNRNNFYWQLDNLGIKCNAYVVENKLEWIQAHASNENHIIIGDSVDDLKVGMLPNVTAWMVGYGVNVKEQFRDIDHRFFSCPSDLLTALKEEINKIAI